MRQIKFRAFYRDFGDSQKPNGSMFYKVMPCDSDFKSWLIAFDEDVPTSFDGNFEVGEDIEVMQFTGLLDKNGKEIYEGDILLLPDTESEYVDVGVGEIKVAEQDIGTIAEVVEGNYAWGVYVKDKSETYEKGFNSFEKLSDNIGSEAELEIIGNIYENPELLK